MCEVCVLFFPEDPLGDFSSVFFFFFFLTIHPLPLNYPRGDHFPQKIYTPRGANSEDITVFGTQDGDRGTITIIYRFLYSSGMCSCRACSTNAYHSTTSPV